MKTEYKKTIINCLFGLIEGNPISLKRYILDRLKEQHGVTADFIDVSFTKKYDCDGTWIGEIKIKTTINEKIFSISRNFEEEYLKDRLHADYDTDLYFYESEKCFAYQKHEQLLEELDNI